MELERHSEDNSRQLESLNGNDVSLFERDMDMYRSEHARLQKANRILINEIKDLLTICYGNRKVGVSSWSQASPPPTPVYCCRRRS